MPLALDAAAVQTRVWPAETSVVPATTDTPFLVSVPLLTNSIRKETGSPSASDKSDAATKAA